MSRKSEGERADLYARITDRIVADLGKGVKPWMKPWPPDYPAPTPQRSALFGHEHSLVMVGGNGARFTSPMWMTFKQAVRRESRMKGVTHGSMSSVQLCRRFPHAVLVTARCEAGMKAQDGNAANAFYRARRRSEGRTRVNSH
ncbi:MULTISPECIES: ArdC-like ssDNA-binding domain-containing protein [Rhizobium]|uniref:N-terminal domain-containing protein n=1 Tax=Rhizobium leguminosarum TaxID=384 RepID=A0A1L3ZPQ2_RHILE|nr:hypothetical protein BMW22_40775 [Rhizobium leguminosarum]